MKSIDLHCDTLLRLHFAGESASLLSNDFHVDLQKLKAGGVDTQVFAVFVPPESESPLQMCLDMIDRFYCELDFNSEHIALAGSAGDIIANRSAGKMSAVLALEDSGTIGSSLSNLRLLHRLGVRIVTLTWNHRNPAGSPNTDAVTASEGLAERGFEFVEEMLRLGMLVDVSHLSDAGFWDVSRAVSGPFIASHSNARSVTYHHRNLTDNMIRCIAEHGGVVGINFYAAFLTGRDNTGKKHTSVGSCKSNSNADDYKHITAEYSNSDRDAKNDQTGGDLLFAQTVPQEADVHDVVDHINHIVKVGGIECVALGGDFDGMDAPPKGLENSSRLPSLFAELEKAGYKQSEIDKISSENAFRVIKEICR